MGWNFADIKRKVRKITGRESTEELSDARLGTKINDYYQYTFPAEVKLEEKFVIYTFNTVANTQEYTFPKTLFTNVEPPFRVDGFKTEWYQDPGFYYNRFPKNYNKISIGSGDAATITFTATLSNNPVLPGSIIVTDNTETFTDNSDGTLTGSAGGTGTIVYATGALSVTFAVAPALGQTLDTSWISFLTGRPQVVLFFDNTFTMNPIPDSVYRCEVQAFQIVGALINATDTPDLQEWGPAIAYGTSKDIFIDAGQTDRYQETDVFHRIEIDNILTRTVQNLSNTRSIPSF